MTDLEFDKARITARFNKTEFIAARVLPEERAVIKEIGRRERLNITEVIRLAIRTLGRKYDVWPPDEISS